MRVAGGDLSREDLERLLTELGGELDRTGHRGDLFVIGGAAIALAYDERRSTRDIDAVFEPKAIIYERAAVVAQRHGLPDSWLNDAAKAFIPPNATESAHVVLDVAGLRVSVPDARLLLALKVAAGRVDRDVDDIEFLANECGVTTAEEVLDLTVRTLGSSRQLETKVQYLIEDLFGPQASRTPEMDPGRSMPAPPGGSRRCNRPTTKGLPCQNQAGTCPHHR